MVIVRLLEVIKLATWKPAEYTNLIHDKVSPGTQQYDA